MRIYDGSFGFDKNALVGIEFAKCVALRIIFPYLVTLVSLAVLGLYCLMLILPFRTHL